MTILKNAPSKLPTRKILAVIVAGAVVGGTQAGLNLLWPDHPFADVLQELDVWVQAGVMIAAGYITRDADVQPTE